MNDKKGGAPSGTPPFVCDPLERYFAFSQSHPPPQRQPALQAQRSPQLHGSTGSPAHPHEAF